MITHGDIPEKDKVLIEELTLLENWFNEHGGGLPGLAIAKGMTCMGHDYYCIHMEEEGDRLLKRAEHYYPGYFKGPIHAQALRDVEFSFILANLKKTLGLEMMLSLGFQDEQV